MQVSKFHEFRVRKVTRYTVTEFHSETYTDDDGTERGNGGSSEVCGPCTLEQANKIAEMFGQANPGSIINKMEPDPDHAATFYFTKEGLEKINARLQAVGIGGIMDLIHE